MAAEQLKAAFPPGLDLPGGWTIELDAVDATSGASVSGVTVSNVTIQVELVSGQAPAEGELKLVNPVLLRTTGA
jgi:hypothetical protein